MDAWKKVATIPHSGISNQAGVLFDKRIISIGGLSNAVVVPYVGATADGSHLENTILAPTGFSARKQAVACSFNERIFLTGGNDGSNTKDTVFTSENREIWQTLGKIPVALQDHGMVSFLTPINVLAVMGGFDGRDYHNSIYTTVDGKNWKTMKVSGTQWSARSGFGCIVYNKKLYVFGGFDGTNYLNDFWYTDNLIKWHKVDTVMPWSIRANFGFCKWDERMWLIGGNNVSTSLKDVWFSRNGSKWTKGFDFPVVVKHTYANEIDNRLHVFGGEGNETSIYKIILG